MSAAGLRPGQIVVSQAGRDRGRRMVVLRVLDDRFVLVVDGVHRRMQNPKKKNCRHLQSGGGVDEQVGRELSAGRQVSDQHIQEALQRVLEGGRDV